MIKEFQEFIARGNVIDMAVGIIMGAAFTTIVNSAVKDVIMPPIGLATGGVDFTNLFVALDGKAYASLAAAQAAAAPTLNYGIFINAIINFLIVAIAVFFLVKAVNEMRRRLERKQEVAPDVPPAPPPQEVLLREIRDLLANRAS
ncbi:MAG: large conductance mechanosensitive channel protein MscL [Alphaproteobacteria bacterium]|nr:large conductance mechanosensitive channel protein MscL [Alphaproteobacteria bacterium]